MKLRFGGLVCHRIMLRKDGRFRGAGVGGVRRCHLLLELVAILLEHEQLLELGIGFIRVWAASNFLLSWKNQEGRF